LIETDANTLCFFADRDEPMQRKDFLILLGGAAA
jgi:hypothetical protein